MNEDEVIKKQFDMEQNKQDIGFLQGAPARHEGSILNKHLEASELLEHLEKLLMGYEWDNQTENYKPIYKTVMQNGNAVKLEQGALLDPNYIRLSIGYIKTFLNANVFLSYIENLDQINSLMWDVNVRLSRLLHPLKNVYDARTVEMTYAMIENPIYMALLRAYKKNTLDAMTKMQHSIEHVGSQQKPMEENAKKNFKVFGF